jgi:hypothetical protein
VLRTRPFAKVALVPWVWILSVVNGVRMSANDTNHLRHFDRGVARNDLMHDASHLYLYMVIV